MKVISFIRANKMVWSGAVLFLIGLLGFLPFHWLQTNHLLFGLLATSPLINLSFLVVGLLWLNQRYPYRGHVFVYKNQLYRGMGIWFAILAIGGFISLPFWPHLWLNLFTNSLASSALYAIIGTFGLIKGFWGSQNASVAAPNAPGALNSVPPQSSNQQQVQG